MQRQLPASPSKIQAAHLPQPALPPQQQHADPTQHVPQDPQKAAEQPRQLPKATPQLPQAVDPPSSIPHYTQETARYRSAIQFPPPVSRTASDSPQKMRPSPMSSPARAAHDR